ncbi:type II toxin-antitoxin system VapC family toxin [Breznakiella homolactica]|uniref:PIN domain nuclease n=1 Tax=Breznakiella homolactica TaxID=2798577 RepID=A0A7T7XQ39_9SPIR|nr:PIN domain nuclease [Breznakiella homolactica]QQO10389.1 PIN domain nuclease [Breznakiella homolactica]
MILVDTSVLIGYFKGAVGKAYQQFDEIIENNVPFGINNVIYQEILQGSKTEKEFDELKEYLQTVLFYDIHNGNHSYEKAAFMYFKCRKAGVTVRSSIDLIIAQTAIENNLYLLHSDNDFVNISKVIKELRLYK